MAFSRGDALRITEYEYYYKERLTLSKLTYRPAALEDFPGCLAIDHSYQTGRIWQMNLTQQAEAIRLNFQAVRLPQNATIPYPYEAAELRKRWWEAHWFWVGEDEAQIQAYITASHETLRPVIWIGDLVVAPHLRRQGHGSDLLAAAATWAKGEGGHYLMTAVPMKNDPAMQFLRHTGFSFCGYNEMQLQKRDIDLYFSLKL
jgi:GNAT superfamily N-acetyltransferase